MTTAKDLVDVLTRHYTGGPGHRDADSHAIYTELPAPGDTRRADLVAVSLWGSRGYGIDVHEIKVSRADWLTELRQPSKAEAWWPHCSRFWLVVPHESIVAEGELPEGWGLMVPPVHAGRRSMRKVVLAAERTPHVPVEFLARVIMREQQRATERLARAHADGEREGRERERRLTEQGADRALLTPHQQKRLDHLAVIEQMFGGELGWAESEVDPHDAADVLEFLRAGHKLPGEWELGNAEQAAQRLLETTKAMRAAMKPLTQPKRKGLAS
jgi:hypothetical protein